MQNLCFGRECTNSGNRSCENSFAPNASILLQYSQDDIWVCFGAFRKCKGCKTCVFRSVLQHFLNLPCVKRTKNCVSGPLWGTQVAKTVSYQMHPFYSLEPKIMFGSILEHFVNLPRVKRCRTYVSGLNALFRGVLKLQKWFRTKCNHSTPLDPN
jgi:hypothetical protein